MFFLVLTSWNRESDSNGLPYYHGDAVRYVHSMLPHVRNFVHDEYATTYLALVDGQRFKDTGHRPIGGIIAPMWTNQRTGKSVLFRSISYKDGIGIIRLAIGCLPREALSDKPNWTKLCLLNRLRRSKLDNAHYRIFGKRGNLITRLNELPHPQPKRLTFSTISDIGECGQSHGRLLYRMMIYGASGRPMEDWRCQPMPMEVYNLGKFLWQKNHAHLTDLSKVCPPNSCQVNFYYSRFKGHIRKHRDNGTRDAKGGVHNMSTPNSENSQLQGTNVMTFTIGDPMNFTLHALRDDKSGKNNAKMYTDVAGLTTTLDDGSCFVLHPSDDEQFMHSAKFAKNGGNSVRIAMNFRWCRNEKWFYGFKSPK